MNIENKDKYLKYKSKYLNLKKSHDVIYGGASGNTKQQIPVLKSHIQRLLHDGVIDKSNLLSIIGEIPDTPTTKTIPPSTSRSPTPTTIPPSTSQPPTAPTPSYTFFGTGKLLKNIGTEFQKNQTVRVYYMRKNEKPLDTKIMIQTMQESKQPAIAYVHIIYSNCLIF